MTGRPTTIADRAWEAMCFPCPPPEAPNLLDVADRLGVFTGPNYSVGEDWVRILCESPVELPEQDARNVVLHALGESTQMPQRDYVRNLIMELRDFFTRNAPDVVARLKELALSNAYPAEAGLVALAVGLKEAAKPGIADIVKCNAILKDKQGAFRSDIRVPVIT